VDRSGAHARGRGGLTWRTAALSAFYTARRLPLDRLYVPIGHDGRRSTYDQAEIRRLLQPENRAELLGTPIRVYRRPAAYHGDTRPHAWVITAGKERVEAARALGLTEIAAIVEAAPPADTHVPPARTTAWAQGDAAASLGPVGADERGSDTLTRVG
jgi:hypothetical protein